MTVGSQVLRVLLVEDDPNDALLIARELERGGLTTEVLRVETEAAFTSALTERTWDVIIADYQLPSFDALRALAVYQTLQLDLPFILVSGTVAEDAAVACMRAGAHDYLTKDRMARLAPVVLRECHIRMERHRAEERYRLLIENCNDLVAEITRAGVVRYASPNHQPQLGLAPKQLVGRNLFEQVHADDRAIVLELLNREARRSAVYRFSGGDGAQHWLESSARAFLTPAGEERLVVITRDISEKVTAEESRRMLEAQLRQAQKMEAIGTLAGGIAHDFNNILVGIIGNVQLAQFESAQNPRALRRLDEALKAGQRARDLVAQILTFSRQREQSPVVTPLGPVVTEALRLLRASLPANIEFVVEIDPAAPEIRCDTSQIHQIVMNLATNAAYAMREHGGKLRVEVKPVTLDSTLLLRQPQMRLGPGVHLTISDTGCGMDAATQQRLFEPFFTTKPVGEGTGLGLAVVHGIVKSHTGVITVESTPQVGTTFHLYFSAATPAALPAKPAGVSATPFGHGERILLVDDEPSVTSTAKLMLERLGYLVDVFSHPVPALAAFHQAPGAFRAVITDLTMPAMSGLDLAREILSVRSDLPVIIMSGNMLPGDFARARAMGIAAIVEKPFSMQYLAKRLSTLLASQAVSA
jgi:PAS domain S-box-containing protein